MPEAYSTGQSCGQETDGHRGGWVVGQRQRCFDKLSMTRGGVRPSSSVAERLACLYGADDTLLLGFAVDGWPLAAGFYLAQRSQQRLDPLVRGLARVAADRFLKMQVHEEELNKNFFV